MLTHADDSRHVTFPSGGRCPSTHPRALPRLIERFEYPVGPNSAGLSLCSGPTFTAHADFWNTWRQGGLTDLTARCLNSDVDCGTNPRTDG